MSKQFQCWLGNTKIALPFPKTFRMTGNVSRKSFCRCSLPPLPDVPETPPLPFRTPTTQAISPFSQRKSCKPPEYSAGIKRHQTTIKEHRRRQQYTYDFVESALLLKHLMYVTVR